VSRNPRRVLLVSPHFPPDASAGAHRMRVLAPFLAQHGWEPVVLTVDPAYYEGAIDRELADSVPASIEVVRCPALPVAWTRPLGVGDLGLRALPRLAPIARRLVETRGMHAVYLTTYPVYPALLGPWLRRTTGVRFVLDLQDPWVGAWGAGVGPRADGRPDMKSRASRALATRLERLVLPQADAITGVSSDLLDELVRRYPVLASRPRAVIPIGIVPADLEWARRDLPDRHEAGTLQLSYIGTLLPLGLDTVRALFAAMAQVRARREHGARDLRAEFVGTSNQSDAEAEPRVRALAREAGLDAVVREHAPRVPFFDALRALMRADVVLLLGTSEGRYTASKLSTALAANRPILAIFHDGSDVTRTLRPLAARDPGVSLVEYGDERPVASVVPAIAAVLDRWRSVPPPAPSTARAALEPYLADRLAGRLAHVLDAVSEPVHV
jgi:glycosyltransferase involved in cell wall biosynthesis